MRTSLNSLILCVVLGGCAIDSERHSLGYGDYLAMSCDQLGQEAVRLMREAADRSEHMLTNDQDRRDRANLQLRAVKQASVEKECSVAKQ